MPSDSEPRTQIRPLPEPASLAEGAAAFVARAPLLQDDGGGRARYVTRVVIAAVAVLLLALIGYETFIAPDDEGLAWRPPAGLTAEQTPQWLQALCLERTPELCAAADRARTASDCEAMRAALRQLEAVDRKLSARGSVSAQQHWVLVELYGQGHELCQFESAARPGSAAE